MIGEQEEHAGLWDFRLYVSNHTPRSVAAFANLKRMCEEHLAGNYRIEVIDLLEQPQLPRKSRSWRFQPWCGEARCRCAG